MCMALSECCVPLQLLDSLSKRNTLQLLYVTFTTPFAAHTHLDGSLSTGNKMSGVAYLALHIIHTPQEILGFR